MMSITLGVMKHLKHNNEEAFELVKNFPIVQKFFCECGNLVETLQVDECSLCTIREYEEWEKNPVVPPKQPDIPF